MSLANNLKCVVCNSQLITSEDDRKLYNANSQSLPRLLDKMFDCLTKFFDLRSSTEWNYIIKFYTQAQETIPFCGTCRSLIAQLIILEEHLEPIERKVSKIKSKLSTTIMKIMDTSAAAHHAVVCDDSFNFEQPAGSQLSSSTIGSRKTMGQEKSMQSTQLLESNIERFRKNIVERFRPRVLLVNCDQNTNKISQLRPHDHRNKSASSTSQPPLFNDDFVDSSKIKLESPSSPLVETVDCHEEDLMNVDFNFENDHPSSLTTTTTTTVEEGFQSFVEEGIVKMENQQESSIKEEIKSEDVEGHNYLPFDDPTNDPLYTPSRRSAGAQKQQQNNGKTNKRKRKRRKHLWTAVKKRNQKQTMVRKPRVRNGQRDFDIKKYFPCSICHYVCTTSFNLMRHQMNMHGKTKNQAKKFQKEFLRDRKKKLTQEKLREKKQLVKERRAKYGLNTFQDSPLLKCDPGEALLSYRNWNYKKTPNDIFICCACGARRMVEGAMTSHITVHHVIRGPDGRSVPKHLNPNYAVDLGEGKYLLYDKWEFTTMDDGRFQCSTCLHTGSRRVVSDHIKKIHAPETCRLICHRCNMGFVSRANLTRHERRHARQRWWKTGCGTYTYDGLYEFDLVDDAYQCGTCGLVNNTVSDITKHIRDIHAEPHNCQCTECGSTFSARDSLKKHQQSNGACTVKRWRILGDGKFLFCNKWFVDTISTTVMTKDGVTEWIRFKCCECGQARIDKTALGAHIKEAHINPKSHVCATCGRAFDKPGELKLHQNCHTTDRPFMCQLTHKTIAGIICGDTFKTKRSLVCHQNGVHHMVKARLSSSSSPFTTETEAAAAPTTATRSPIELITTTVSRVPVSTTTTTTTCTSNQEQILSPTTTTMAEPVASIRKLQPATTTYIFRPLEDCETVILYSD